ncbi:allophanate hydrolase [Rhodococcus globerulus]|uniref:Allophanate hydrolase n=1 Tax=Rhodococcus globerulus TaxID=33008 RepID=A0ABU4BM42_RHOGO|nr:allophanate hydrolase [Rhodococcus globerulus]MDV6265319.1 allophanate hydrolase [Rhodococcus globerulus]
MSATERVSAAYRSIERVDRPEIWIHLRPEVDAMAEAARVDASTADLPLRGLVLAVKDNVDVAGLPTTAGCPEFAYTPAVDAAAVAALRAAGAVVLGKTNLDQFATGLVGTRSPHGAVRDSRRPEYISGGSSSGSAVAVALGLVDIAIGTDTAGSGRVPAGLQGIVGIKPTVGVVSTEGVVPACSSYDCVTIFAADLAGAESAMAVMASGAPGRQWPSDVRLAAPPRPRVAVPAVLPGLDEQWAAAFGAAVEQLRAAGAEVVEIDLTLFLDAARLLYDGALVAERYAAVGEFVDAHADAVDPTVRSIIAPAGVIPAHRLLADRELLAQLRNRAMKELDGLDALMVPTAPEHPTIAEVAADPIGVNSHMGTYTNFCNLFDLAAVAVPAGRAGNAQFGVTVLARAFEDGVAADIAAMVNGDQATGWTSGPADTVELAVFGAHLRGQPLEHQLTGLGARWCGPVATAPRYRLSALDTAPPKPGLIRVTEGGVSIVGERWQLTPAALGTFLAALPTPMMLGSVEFDDGSWGTGFGCDQEAASTGKDISEYGGWQAALSAGAVG